MHVNMIFSRNLCYTFRINFLSVGDAKYFFYLNVLNLIDIIKKSGFRIENSVATTF